MPFWDDGLSLWWISIEIAKFHLNDGINIVYSDNIVIQKNCAALNLYGVLCVYSALRGSFNEIEQGVTP